MGNDRAPMKDSKIILEKVLRFCRAVRALGTVRGDADRIANDLQL
jgi:hypothetical protein